MKLKKDFNVTLENESPHQKQREATSVNIFQLAKYLTDSPKYAKHIMY